MRFERDQDADAVYVHLRDAEYDHGDDLDPDRRVDLGADGTPVGIELLNVSLGVDVRGLPSEDDVARKLVELGIKVLSRSQ